MPARTKTANLPVCREPDRSLPTISQDKISELIEAFFADKSAQTRRAYEKDLEDFRTFLKADDITQAAKTLMGQGNGNANYIALKYRQSLAERKLAPATINRRLAALRSMINLANFLGMIPWRLAIRGPKGQRYRDTRGPGSGNVHRMIEVAGKQSGPRAVRDVAILRLLYGLALRRGEVAALTLHDVDLGRSLIAVKGKGRTEHEFLEMPPQVESAIEAWLLIRGQEAGPLFLAIGASGQLKSGLSDQAIYRLVVEFGGQLGMKVRPHGLRHSAITEACRNAHRLGLSIRDVKDFSRHADLKTLEIYWDRSDSAQGKLAGLVDAAA